MRYRREWIRSWGYVVASLAAWGGTQPALAASITFSGTITQSTADGTGPAVNNPSLNSIADSDHYSVVLTFSASVTSTGTYPLAPGSLLFSDPGAPASESSFGTFLCAGVSSIVCLTVTADGSFDDISLLGCLTTGGGCMAGNQLAANFKIPAASLNSASAAAQPIAALTPLDLLEDDGGTDIHGSVSNYSFAGSGPGPSPVPEPSTLVLGAALFMWTALRLRHNKEKKR